MQILARTVHTVQQTVFWGWLSCACCCATTGALVGARRKLWSSAVAVLLGVAQSRVAFGRFFYDFLRDWEDSARFSSFSAHMADEEVAVLVVNSGSGLRLLVLLMMHLALSSR